MQDNVIIFLLAEPPVVEKDHDGVLRACRCAFRSGPLRGFDDFQNLSHGDSRILKISGIKVACLKLSGVGSSFETRKTWAKTYNNR
jgi:hypothetical protein